jgi:hypothetical protein
MWRGPNLIKRSLKNLKDTIELLGKQRRKDVAKEEKKLFSNID